MAQVCEFCIREVATILAKQIIEFDLDELTDEVLENLSVLLGIHFPNREEMHRTFEHLREYLRL